MDRNTLLRSSRTKLMSVFNELIEDVVHQSLETFFQKADKSFSSQEQRYWLDARILVAKNEKALVEQIIKNLEMLLDRSFQTAYDNFRPSFFEASHTKTIQLLDPNALEGDLKLEKITNGFRNGADEQLRDLNIRIAILFDCNDIAERENPFRPYLFTKAIVLGVEAMQAEPELSPLIVDQLAELLQPQVAKIYEAVNTHLSECGVAAQLQFRPYRSMPDIETTTDDASLETLMDIRQVLVPTASNLSDIAIENKTLAVPNQFARIESLLSTIKQRQQSQPQARSEITDFPTINPDLLEESNKQPGAVGNLIDQAGSKVSGWLEGMHKVGDALRGVFRGTPQHSKDNDSEKSQLGSEGHAAISPKLNQVLRVSMPALTEMMSSDGEVRNLLIESRDNLNSLASTQYEKMTIDIVAMLFDFILKDPQVPAEVRAQLGRLQFSVLKMALMDSALLTQKSHPARLLVNRIGSISVGLQQIDPTGERISAEICSIVEELLASEVDSPELFSKMLDHLDVFIARELLASSTAGIENATKVAANAEQRIQRFEHASVELEKLLSSIPVPAYLSHFLLETWLYVIERTERDCNTDATRFRMLVPELMWSVLPKATEEDRHLLLQIIPNLVAILREGMNLIHWQESQQKEILDWLVEIHTTVVRDAEMNKVSQGSVPSLADIKNQFQHFIFPGELVAVEPKLPSKLKAQRFFINEAIHELEAELHANNILENWNVEQSATPQEVNANLSAEVDLFKSGLLPEKSSSLTEPVSASEIEHTEEDLLERLRSGVMVEINLSGIPTLGRLNWISPNASNLILTMSGQATPSVISVRMFRRMLKNSHARFVEVAPLFERAVQSLLESADLVDLAHSS